jgi:GntR family transcriptional regulator, N-acetylglucosamine utilization regulator
MSTGPLDKDLPVPLYHQLHEVLRAEIEAGRWLPGGQIPTETQLVERFGVSKITVRQALQQLVDGGYVRREHGRGTFVSLCKFDEGPRELTSFTEEMRRHSLMAGARTLEQAGGAAEGRVAEALRVPAGSPIFLLKRVRLAGGEPVTIQTAHIPAALVPGIAVADGDSLYDVLQSRYDLFAARARETYIAGLADADSAGMLGIEAGAPVFQVERVTFLPNGKPFEFVRSTIRGDRYAIVLDLVKHGAESRTFEWNKSAAAPDRV